MSTFATEKRVHRPFEGIHTARPVPCGNGQPCPPPPRTHEEIARCAHDIYIAHGRAEGRSELNWRQAEEQLAQTPRTSPLKPEASSRS